MNRAEWNRHAESFEANVCDITKTDRKAYLSRLMGLARLPKRGATLVDLGCGLGTFIKRFGDRFDKIVGIDFAPRIVMRAEKIIAPRQGAAPEKIDWLAMDIARSAAVLGAVADLTVCLNVITSPSGARRRDLWANVAAVTRLRGFALIVVPSLESARVVREFGTRRRARGDKDESGILARSGARQKHYSREELVEVMAQHGLVKWRISRVFYPWSEEGMSRPRRRGANHPWDWGVIAQRVA